MNAPISTEDFETFTESTLAEEAVVLTLEEGAGMEEEGVVGEERPGSESDAVDVTQIYLKALAGPKLLTAEEEKHYGRLARQGDKHAFDTMVESNLRLVVKLCRRYQNRGLAMLDLIEEGNLGLMHAVEKFDADRGFRFSTYATWWIRQTIERAIMNQTRTIRLPIHVVKELNGCLRAYRYLGMTLDHEPSAKDVAAYLNVPVKSVEKMLSLNERIVSLDASVTPDSDKPIVEAVADEREEAIPDVLAEQGMAERIESWLSELSERQQDVVCRRFGLRNCDETTLEDLAALLGVTRERVRQIQAESLKLLKQRIEDEGFTVDLLFH